MGAINHSEIKKVPLEEAEDEKVTISKKRYEELLSFEKTVLEIGELLTSD